MECPAYFEEIRRRSSNRWDQLDSDPELAAPWHQLFKQVQSPRHVLSELLQNADDAGATETSVRMDDGFFVFTHNGEDFTEEHFASLCRFGYSNKRALHTIGFRGIGFKSTFSLGDIVELYSPTLAVAFERRRFTEPTWLDSSFGSVGSTSIRVAFASKHQRREVEKNLQAWFKSPVSLLFFNHIRRMRVGDQEVYWGSLGPGPVRDSEWMALHHHRNQSYLVATSESEPFPEEALDEIKQERLLSVDDGTTFPPCRVEIVVGAKGRLYVVLPVLPTGVETALPFACNAPFIQDPARLKIKDPETSPTNRWLLERVGQLAAKVLLEWLEPASGSVAVRSDAYGVFPDVDRDDSSLEGTVAAIVEQSFDAEISGKPFLLTDAGELMPAGGSVIVPSALFEVWPGEQAAAVLDDAGRPAFSRHVSSTDRRKLLHWNVVETFTKDAVLQSLRTKHLPKPESWRRLLNLWAYVAPELTNYRFQSIKQLVRIVPVQGKEVLYSATEVVRLGEKRLLQSDADWECLAEHLLVLNQNWPRFLAEQRRVTDGGEGVAGKDDVEAAAAVLSAIGLVEASDPGYVLERVAADFFGQKSVSLEGCVQFAQIAAKLGASASKTFRYATRDRHLRAVDHVVLFDIDGTLEASFPSLWATAHFLHESYSTFRSCTSEEWARWVTSGRAGISTLAPLQSKREHLYGQQRLANELKRRGFTGSTSNPYVTSSFVIEDWDFDGSLWPHWDILAKDDQAFWGGLVERLLAQPETYWAKAKTARALQVATTGNTRPVTYDPILPAWILRLRDLPCLRDTRGVRRKPGELLRRTPETEPFLDVEFFVHALLDGEAVRPLLTLLGVRDTPTGPDRLISCLRALAHTDSPPIAEVEKWYRRLDQMIDTCSTADQANIHHAFHNEKLVFTESSGWVTSGGVYLSTDEEDAPGAAVVRASVRDLALWRKIGVEDRPTSDLAIRWLTELPTGKPLSQDDVRRVRALLTRHPVRIWNECGRWLNLAGEWVPIDGLTYALTMQSLVPWSHFHDWVKQATADLQRLGAEIADVHPFANLRRLADSVEDRLALLFPGTPQRKPWLNQLGSELRRIELDDNVEVERIRALAERLQDTVWLEGPELEMIPYIGGTPAGTSRRAEVVWMDRTLHVVRRPPARLARAVSQELGRAFRRPDVADVIKLCFDRSPEFVTEVVEENFTLASHVRPDEARVQDNAEAAVDSPGGSGRGELTLPPDVEPAGEEIVESPDEPGIDAIDIDPGTGEPVRKERPATKPTRPPIIERFARSQGFQRDGDDRFYHPDGSWIARTHGARFPWERRTAAGELLRSYWSKDHCLDLEPLLLEADLWSLIDKFPDRYALVLASPSGQPIEVPGVGLRAMLEQGQLKILIRPPIDSSSVLNHERRPQDTRRRPDSMTIGNQTVQELLFEEPDSVGTGAAEWDRNSAQRSIDELFQFARQYTSSESFNGLMRFIARFRLYSPFNAMLAHIQMPGATFVAPPYRWRRDYGRRIKPGARPVVLLQPMGPVMFAFDVSDTEPLPDAKPLPRDVEKPFEVRGGRVGNELERSVENAKRDGIRVVERDAGSQSAGQIGIAKPGASVRFLIKSRPEAVYRDFAVKYELLLNAKHSPEAKYVTLVHELAHLYCGHLGTPNEHWWPDRRGLTEAVREFEAESVAFLVCSRLGIDNPSDEYLSGYVKGNPETPAISLDCVLKAAGLVEQMGRERMKVRKEMDT